MIVNIAHTTLLHVLQDWNEELAAVAQAHAERCSFTENENRAENVSFLTVGENLSATNANTPNYTRFVEMAWFSQRVNYDYQSNMCTSQDSCADYIQVVYKCVHVYLWVK